jgi:hypothetical protein
MLRDVVPHYDRDLTKLDPALTRCTMEMFS